jgi:hypothetical protein
MSVGFQSLASCGRGGLNSFYSSYDGKVNAFYFSYHQSHDDEHEFPFLKKGEMKEAVHIV